MNWKVNSKKSLYLFVSLVLVFVISSIFIVKDLRSARINESINYMDNDEEVLIGLQYEDVNVYDENGQGLEEYINDEIIEAEKIELNLTQNNGVNTYVNANSKNLEPISGERYIVSRGDTLYLIARRANMSIDELRDINNIQQVDAIYEGQVIKTKRTNQVSNNNSSSNTSNSNNTREDDIYWLSRIIHAEAQGESYVGKVAVGNVVLNRVAHRDFPNTIYGVIYDKQYGYVQFSPVLDGSINNTPNEDSRRAAIEALNGSRPVGEALYFLNPTKATNFWIVHNRRYFMTIGDHDFYF